jgi:hypothetical protein
LEPDVPLAMRRRGRPDFQVSFSALEEAVRLACEPHVQWEAGVVAGIQAALHFAGEKPEMVHVLIVQGRRERTDRGDREREVIAHFAALLADAAPPEIRNSVTTGEAVIAAIATIVRGHLQAGTERQLTMRSPDVVYLALMPYLGIDGARRWSDTLGSAR